MALWDGSSIDTTNEALGLNKFLTYNALDEVSKNNALVFALLGKPSNMSEVYNVAAKDAKIQSTAGMVAVEGIKQEYTYIGELETITGVASGADEHTEVASSFNADAFGGAEFSLTHLTHHIYLERSRLMKIRGKGAKGAPFKDQELDRILRSYWNTISVHINADQDQTETTIGGWPFAIDEGNTYMTRDRSDAGNVNFRGYEESIGTLADTDLWTAQNSVVGEGGNPNFGICGPSVYTTVQDIASGLTQVQVSNDDWLKFPGPKLWFSGIPYFIDGRAPSGMLGLLDLSTWQLIMHEDGIKATDFKDSETKKSAVWSFTEWWIGFVCRMPKWNAKLTDI